MEIRAVQVHLEAHHPVVGIEGEGDVARLQAVSYTHLRAHETVLDLVCRLLLEKKKYQAIHLFHCDPRHQTKRNVRVHRTGHTTGHHQ